MTSESTIVLSSSVRLWLTCQFVLRFENLLEILSFELCKANVIKFKFYSNHVYHSQAQTFSSHKLYDNNITKYMIHSDKHEKGS